MLDPASQQGELALLFLRIYSVLYALTGGDMDWMRHFMNTSNGLDRWSSCGTNRK